MKIFISQPMKGKTLEEIIQRRNAIKEKICKIFNRDDIEITGLITADDGVTKRSSCLGKSIQRMSESDLVYFTHDWETAAGCCIEMRVAKNYGFPYYVEGNSILNDL